MREILGTWAAFLIGAGVLGALTAATAVALHKSGAKTLLIGFPIGFFVVGSLALGEDTVSLVDALVLVTACVLGGALGSSAVLYGRWISGILRGSEPPKPSNANGQVRR